MPQLSYGGQKTTLGSQFSLSTVWVPGMELGLSGLASSAVTHRAISPARVASLHGSHLLQRIRTK